MPPRTKPKSASKSSGKAKRVKPSTGLNHNPFKRGIPQIVMTKPLKPKKRNPKLNKAIRDAQVGLPNVRYVEVKVDGIVHRAQIDKIGRVRKII